MDLTFGLPETSNGHRGLITMIDYLTKFVKFLKQIVRVLKNL
jgi:hypothetical protein